MSRRSDQRGRLEPGPLWVLVAVAVWALTAPIAGAASAQSDQPVASGPTDAVLREKVRLVQQGAEAWRAAGRDPTPIGLMTLPVESLIRKGERDKANALLDAAFVALGISPARGSAGERPRSRPEGQGPLISNTQPPAGLSSDVVNDPLLIWNDPSVLKEGSGYRMWLSLGRGGAHGVSIYTLSSSDGMRWAAEHGGRPVLTPGDKKRGAFDWFGVETPAVIKVGDTYHMYYSAYKDGRVPLCTMGHATSSDGVSWTRLGELLPVTEPVGEPAGNRWGWLARCEPSAVYRDGTFLLYFTDVKCRQSDCQGSPRAIRGISVATSSDGHHFQQVGTEPVLLPSRSYPAAQGWEGYSTPWALLSGQGIDLFVDVFRSTGEDAVQTALAWYRSKDGIRFREVAANVVVAGGEDWSRVSVRAPSVVAEADAVKLWYAGDSVDPKRHAPDDLRSGRAVVGIGYTELKEPGRR